MNEIERHDNIIREISEESEITLPTSPYMSVEVYLEGFGMIPYEAILLGVSDDGLPVLVNIKTDESIHTVVQMGLPVLNTVYEFYRLTKSRLYEVVWLSDNLDIAGQQLIALASWSHVNNRRKDVVLLVPNLEQIFRQDFDEKLNFKWILQNGHKYGVLVIASYNELSDVGILELFNIQATARSNGYVIPCRGQKETKLFPLG